MTRPRIPVPPPVRQPAAHVLQMTRAVHPPQASRLQPPPLPVHPRRSVVQGKIYDIFGRKLDTSDEGDIVLYLEVMSRVNHQRLREFREMLIADLGTLDRAAIRTVRRLNAILGDLPVSTGQPPASWAVVDAHLPIGDEAPFWRMPAHPPVTKGTGASAVAEEQNLVRYVYRSSTGWDVNLYWPKGWLPPAVNRLNMIPNGEFGNALGGMKEPQPTHVLFSYTAFGGVMQTPASVYVPAGPKREQEKDDNYYRFQDEYGPLERLYDDEAIDDEEFERRLKLLKLKYHQT